MWKIDYKPGCCTAHFYKDGAAVCGAASGSKYNYGPNNKKYQRLFNVSDDYPVKKRCKKCMKISRFKHEEDMKEEMEEAKPCDNPFKYFGTDDLMEKASSNYIFLGTEYHFTIK